MGDVIGYFNSSDGLTTILNRNGKAVIEINDKLYEIGAMEASVAPTDEEIAECLEFAKESAGNGAFVNRLGFNKIYRGYIHTIKNNYVRSKCTFFIRPM